MRRSRISIGLLLWGLFWIVPADAQVGAQATPVWSLSVREGRLTADINRVPLRLVLEELARQIPLRLSANGRSGNHLVTAHFRARPLDEALAELFAGVSYGIVQFPAPAGTESAAAGHIVELLVFEKASAVKSDTEAAPGQGQATTLGMTPEWTAALQHPTATVRLDALQRWASQGAATPLDPLTYALVDPDESVRTRAQQLVERVWAAKAQAK